MAGGRAVAGAARGGELVPSLRPPLIVAATLCVAGAGALAALGADSSVQLVELLVLVAVVLLVPALLLRRPGFIGPALALVGTGYAVSVAGHADAADQLVVIVAPLLIVGAELAYWSVESPSSVRDEPALVLRRLAAVLALALLAAAAAAFLLASSDLAVDGGVELLAAGVAAATGVLALVARLARRGARV